MRQGPQLNVLQLTHQLVSVWQSEYGIYRAGAKRRQTERRQRQGNELVHDITRLSQLRKQANGSPDNRKMGFDASLGRAGGFVVNATEQRRRAGRGSDPACGTLNWRVLRRPILNLIR